MRKQPDAFRDKLLERTTKNWIRPWSTFKSLAHLGEYYSDKIFGATYLALYRSLAEDALQKKAVQHLEQAARHWIDFVETAKPHHKNPIWTNRVGYVDWTKTYRRVIQDIALAGGDPEKLDLPSTLKDKN